MIPELIQKRGAVHLAEAAAAPLASDLNPPRAVLDLIPGSVARENHVLPMRVEGETLYVAAADPNDLFLADKLGFIVNKKVRFVRHPWDQIRAALDRHFGDSETESVDSMLTEFTDTAVDFSRTHAGVASRSSLLSAGCVLPAPAARSPGTRLVEFKKGMKGIEDDEDDADDDFRAVGPPRPPGEDPTPYRLYDIGDSGMFYYTVEEGQRALMTDRTGRIEVVVGPRRVWSWRRRFLRMKHFVAHPGEFLVVLYRDGRQDHVPGPAELWFDPRVHEKVTRQDALQLAAKEAVVVYSRAADSAAVARRIVYGPTLFVPAPGEWLHTFQWHGSDGGSQGAKKVAKGLVFQKLWLMPDQMYHDVSDVRTADDAVLTVRLMIFFELVDIERMLEATHDPIGDFVNAATSDVVDFTGRRTFEALKQNTGELNELSTYRQLTARAAQNGYRVNKVVYRGYGAPDRLQAMHDQAIEARTKLQLERATEEQAQNLEDFKLDAQVARSAKRRTEQQIEVDTEIELSRRRQEAELRQKEAERDAARAQRVRDADAEQEIRRSGEERTRQHLGALREMGVDLTAYLTQGRADRVIELRGHKGVNPHLHLDNANGDG